MNLLNNASIKESYVVAAPSAIEVAPATDKNLSIPPYQPFHAPPDDKPLNSKVLRFPSVFTRETLEVHSWKGTVVNGGLSQNKTLGCVSIPILISNVKAKYRDQKIRNTMRKINARKLKKKT